MQEICGLTQGKLDSIFSMITIQTLSPETKAYNMIVYLASHPRSGNFWLQNLIGNQFKRLTTDVHYGMNDPNILAHWTADNKRHYNIDVYPLNVRERTRYSQLSDWMVSYKSPEEEELHKGILPGCLKPLNSLRIRSILAEDQETYFVKTHFYPHSKYLEGEYAIQIVRNPGACLWSHYNFKRDLMKEYNEDLSHLIRGDAVFGSWSEYHFKWAEIAKKLGSRYLFVRYEDLFRNELEFCKKLQSFLGLQIVSSELQPFDFYHKLLPTLTREGKSGGWEKNYSKDQLKLLWNTHRNMMTQFGYQEPNYDLGMYKAQY